MDSLEKDEIEKREIEFEKEKKSLKIKFVIYTLIISIIVAVLSSEFTLGFYARQNKLDKKASSENSSKNIDIIAENLKNFRKTIDQSFVGEIDEEKIQDETLKGYVNGLGDEYSEYMTKNEWSEFQAAALGNFAGIGIYMSVDENDNIVVLAPIPETPAEEAGLKSGDVIISVNDENVIGVSSDVVSAKIKGEVGTEVKITVLRDSEYKDFTIKRAEIKVYHVESKMLENKVGYISLKTFDENCSDEFKTNYDKLKSEGAEKIILDLRDNTGGLVEEALSIADMFLEKDEKILITVDSKGNEEISTAKSDRIIKEDTVVLINEYSASASEILVGALKDNGKVKTVGKKSFGKGVIQNVYELTDGSVLKLTVNEYFTPNKTKINKVGISPDYEVDLDKEEEKDSAIEKALELLK